MTQNQNETPALNEKPPRLKQRITPRALLEVKRLSDLKIHPDGQRVAFVVTEADFEESQWISHLWLTEWIPEESGHTDGDLATEETREEKSEPDSTEEAEEDNDPTRQLTFSRDGETNPKWSPDGRSLAFLSSRIDETESLNDDDDDEPKEQIWLLPIDGGEARKLTSAKEGVLDYTWLPDGKTLVYLAPEPRPRPVEQTRKDERDRRKIDPVVEHEERLRRQFWQIDVDDKKAKRLFTADYGVTEFDISPDGERLCYLTNYTGEWNDYHLGDIWVRNLAHGAAFKLVDRPGGKSTLRWSPDGKRIAFLSWVDPELSYSRESLYVADIPESVENFVPEGQGIEIGPTAKAVSECRLLSDLDYDITEFEWSRQDEKIVAVAAVRTGDVLYRIDAETTERLELEGDGERSYIHLDTESAAFVFVQEGPQTLPEIFGRDEDGKIHQLTKLNAEFTENYRLPRQEIVQWKSADGTGVEGVLTYPLDYQEGTKAPLVVQIHGGPKGRATHTLRGYTMAPVWSAEGYAVLEPNFRGSEGYGNAFAIANRRDLGGGDFADIMAGVDWCLAAGIADPDRLGVMGGSYGGYMTNWAIGHTDRFRAAISMFGIFHLQTDYSNSELSRWNNDYLGGYYWEDPEIYQRLSPGSYIANIKTPTLILHGDDDANTFISNSKELYQALRHRGVVTQFVHYPREGHGLREPNHKLDEIRRCLAWMDRYVLKGGQAPSLYRLGDKIPSADGLLELRVLRAEIATFVGQPKPDKKKPDETSTLLEVAFTLYNPDTRRAADPLTFALSELRLEGPKPDTSDGANLSGGYKTRTPIGVPLDVPGGKVLLEGDNLRTAQHPDAETGQLAFACVAVFRVPIAGGEYLLRIGTFAPVTIAWSAEDEEEAEEKANKEEE